MPELGVWIRGCESAHCVQVRFNEDFTVDVGSSNSEVYLTFTQQEWQTFLGGVGQGHFDF